MVKILACCHMFRQGTILFRQVELPNCCMQFHLQQHQLHVGMYGQLEKIKTFCLFSLNHTYIKNNSPLTNFKSICCIIVYFNRVKYWYLIGFICCPKTSNYNNCLISTNVENSTCRIRPRNIKKILIGKVEKIVKVNCSIILYSTFYLSLCFSGQRNCKNSRAIGFLWSKFSPVRIWSEEKTETYF